MPTLNRWRHVISVTFAAFAGAAILSGFDEGFDVEWSPLSVIFLFAVLGSVIWWFAECAIAAVMAIWETRTFHLLRGPELPTVRLLRGWRRGLRK